ncbi:MAG TPA: type ISP restriction/modification enzyme [Aggregatilineaceae bacterium]|nr:type ISP restriction/modification enzyme [Aggregatilineaceae bacterium]
MIDVVYSFDNQVLATRIEEFCDNYNAEVDRFLRKSKGRKVDDFVDYTKLKWSRNLKRFLVAGKQLDYVSHNICQAIYRPFTKKYLYFAPIAIDEFGLFPHFFPRLNGVQENLILWIKVGSDWPMFPLMSSYPVDYLPQGGSQCFPFYVYDEDGSNRRENITDWALQQFRTHYADETISKWDIFYYVYGLLHHPGYRARYADNLKRDLPRIPFAPDLRGFADAGQKLADLHLNYETVEPHKLTWVCDDQVKMTYRVEKMRLSKDKTRLVVNNWLTLADIPADVYEYRLGNRSALEWVIDQYQVKTDKRSGIVSDPNNADDPPYIVNLVERVVRVSLDTVNLVNALPSLLAGVG